MDPMWAAPCTGPGLQEQRLDGPPDGNPPKPSVTEPSLALSPIEITNNGCILVVDDNEAVREMLADVIESAGFCTFQAVDAAQALVILRDRGDIAALVTDLSMPGADGITLIRQAREIYPGLPAILLTGYAEEVSSVSTTTGGNFHVLRKPVASDRLIEQIVLRVAQARPA
jgi:DNA-binding NtrC family response regulator